MIKLNKNTKAMLDGFVWDPCNKLLEILILKLIRQCKMRVKSVSF
jgi:hypothetical protein